MRRLTLILVLVLLTGCNEQIIDLTHKFDYAIITLPNGEIVEGDVTSWMDYQDSDSIQIVIDGVTYYTHINNVVLIDK